MIHALLVDDDPELRTLMAGYLQQYGMRVTTLADGAALRRTLPTGQPGTGDPFDVLLLDVMLPDANGLDLCRWVRTTWPMPVIMLTAQGDPASRIVGLELGADDYLPKPFEPRELVARINAVLRRAGAARTTPTTPHADAVVHFNGWVFDRLHRQLSSPQQVVLALSSAEFRLLSAFVDHPRRVLSRDRLIDLAHSPGVDVTGRSIDLAVSRLRQKLEDPALIRTVRGEGYSFDVDLG
ncbi:MAG: response regulator transcription factor [Rhizobacter sp.]